MKQVKARFALCLGMAFENLVLLGEIRHRVFAWQIEHSGQPLPKKTKCKTLARFVRLRSKSSTSPKIRGFLLLCVLKYARLGRPAYVLGGRLEAVRYAGVPACRLYLDFV